MKFITVLLCVALVQIVSATVISLEEGDADTKRVFKWILDPVSPSFPLPRFRVQNGMDADYKEFRFLATLNCSEVPDGDVAMAIYDPVIDDWNCTSTGNLPNDTSVPDDQVNGLPKNCSRNFVAVWNRTLSEWSCSDREALLFQSTPLIVDQQCRSEDLLTINYDTDVYRDAAAGLCVNAETRQVGPDASVKLKRVVQKNVGDPDETFFVQTGSKAVGNYSQTVAREHYNWQYWAWSPIRSSFSSSVGSYPPIMPFDGLHLAAVISSTFTWSSAGNVYSAASIPIQFNVVKLSITFTGTYPSITYMQYRADTFTLAPITAPGIVTYSNISTILPNVALTKANALSVVITTFPPGFTQAPKTAWFQVSLWFSYIQKET